MTTTTEELVPTSDYSQDQLIKALVDKLEHICNDSDIFDSVVESVASDYGIDEEELMTTLTGNFEVSIN